MVYCRALLSKRASKVQISKVDEAVAQAETEEKILEIAAAGAAGVEADIGIVTDALVAVVVGIEIEMNTAGIEEEVRNNLILICGLCLLVAL